MSQVGDCVHCILRGLDANTDFLEVVRQGAGRRRWVFRNQVSDCFLTVEGVVDQLVARVSRVLEMVGD